MKDILLKYLSDFSTLSDNDKLIIVDAFQEKKLSKNDFLVKQGDISKDFSFVCEGILRIYHEVDGEEITLQFLLPKSFAASLSSLAFNMPGQWNIQAITNCKLLYIDRDVHHEIMSKYAKALNIYESQFLKAFSNLENRILSFLHLNAEQRFQKLFSEQPQIFNLVPLKHIASSLGITAETLSRLRKKQFI
jgi:CRP/FNR family transcriptional regulator, anaerobic regulatory protein